MKKHRILMKPDNAQKTHDGDKTVTRRIINPQPPDGITGVTETVVDGKSCWCFERKLSNGEWEFWHARSRYKKCDIVGIAETHWRYGRHVINGQPPHGWKFCPVKTDGRTQAVFDDPEDEIAKGNRMELGYHKRPGLFLPYDLCRTHVLIEDVRPERLQDITEADALAEGIRAFEFSVPPNPPGQTETRYGIVDYFPQTEANPVSAFRYRLWNPINGKKYPWAGNWWVFRYLYRVTEKPKG